MDSGYAVDIIDKHFIRVAKLKRKDTLKEKLLGIGNLETAKLILSQHEIRCFLTSITLSENFITFWKRENSAKKLLFPKWSFRISYKGAHKN